MAEQLNLDSSVRLLAGVGTVRAQALAKMGILTIRDLLWNLPRSYEERGHVRTLTEGADGNKSAFLLTVATQPRTARIRNRMTLTKFKAVDECGETAEVVFFNQAYLDGVFHVGDPVRFWGSLHKERVWTLTSPAYEFAKPGVPLPDYHPVYPLTEGISGKMMEGLVASALTVPIPDPLPENIRLSFHLMSRKLALSAVHCPTNREQLREAVRRLAFEELFFLSLCITRRRAKQVLPKVVPCRPCPIEPFLAALPYTLTPSQLEVIRAIRDDLTGDGTGAPVPVMRRILIGDVGSGKTVCAAAAMYVAAMSGYTSAIMVPTEVLAMQHQRDLAPLFATFGMETACLTGSTPPGERKRILSDLSSPAGSIRILIGTHALLNENLTFARLGLTVTDEQHRFGVHQREGLQEKSPDTHVLVMSATPIPRTLALTLYGDLSVSRIVGLPSGRQKVETFVIDETYRQRLYGFIRRQVLDGGQVYIVCPAITDQESGEVDLDTIVASGRDLPPLQSAVSLYDTLSRTVFPDLRIGLLHGQMKSKEKDAVMRSFENGEISILVSTTVIEVGVNVPNACLMVIENAERFGLAQLHQLRGRVGRGKRKSWCILISDSHSGQADARLRVLTETNDGYEIAERDLTIRGPGDFFRSMGAGDIRQSGGIRFRLAASCDDPQLPASAFRAASRITDDDPDLVQTEHASLRAECARFDATV